LVKVERLLGGIGTNIIRAFRKEVPRKKIVTASYFKGDISEGAHTNIFFEPSTFETWGKATIADDRHFQVNGYANAWYITPKDFDGKENYELIVEVVGQKIFYTTLALSLLIFTGCLLWGLKFFLTPYERT
jgi:hypothetical protein